MINGGGGWGEARCGENREREKAQVVGRDQIRQNLANQMKEYGLYSNRIWSQRKLEGSIIRFAYEKMCRKKRRVRTENGETGQELIVCIRPEMRFSGPGGPLQRCRWEVDSRVIMEQK